MLPAKMQRFIEANAPAHSRMQEEMIEYAETRDFPIIGRAAGSFLMSIAQMRDAERVFEFGSGFGYSASWFLRGMAPGGTIVLTQKDQPEYDLAHEFLDPLMEDFAIHIERGDALDIAERYPGPFDMVLFDHDKTAYADAFEHILPKLAEGGVLIADNIMSGPVKYAELLPYLEDDAGLPDEPRPAGIVSYLRTVASHPHTHTSVIPIGSGIALTTIDPERF